MKVIEIKKTSKREVAKAEKKYAAAGFPLRRLSYWVVVPKKAKKKGKE